jgi:hypothetical protein
MGAAPLGEALEGGAQRLDLAPRTPLVEGATEFGESIRFADNEPTEPQYSPLHHERELPLCWVTQIGFEVAAVLEVAYLVVDRVAGLVDGADDDFREEVLLVGEVLVDGLLGDGGKRRDLVASWPRSRESRSAWRSISARNCRSSSWSAASRGTSFLPAWRITHPVPTARLS